MRSKSIWRLIVALFAFLLATAAAQAQLQLVHGHVPTAVKSLTPIARFPATNYLDFDISLPLRNHDALSNFLHQVYDPHSPNYRQYLTPAGFAEQFGPSASDYQAVIDFARDHNLQVTATYPSRMLVDLRGTGADVESAFHLHLHTYRHPTENRNFFAPDTDPSLDLAVPVLQIGGLDNFSLPRPRYRIKPLVAGQKPLPNAGSGPSGTYMGGDFRAAYAPGTTLNGTGQTVGLLQFDGYTPADITYYENFANIPSITISNALIDGYNGFPSGDGGENEVSLDIEMVASMATNLTKLVVYEAPQTGLSSTWHHILAAMADDNLAKSMSCSWFIPGGTNDATAENYFIQMATQGQSFFNASGDDDAWVGLIYFPGDSPNVTQVGGTTLTTTGPGGSYVSETVWNWGSGTGSGGGVSTQYPLPPYQSGISMSANQGSTTQRNTPDVAFTADQIYVRVDGEDWNLGGTSCAAPLWAGFAALCNQQAVAGGRHVIGFINQALENIGLGPNYTSAFHDITVGNNESPGSPGQFSAEPGYDLCTGWGTPNGQVLINALASPENLVITPGTGFTSTGGVGGPFTVTSETFTLTNTGASSLTWSLSNTSSWLTASSTGGALPAASPSVTVTVGLNANASNLVAGVYNATLWFTNLTDTVGQARQFTLSVIAPPSVTTQPTNQAVLQGANASFSVAATGGLPLYYQWQFNQTNLTDAGNIVGSATTNLVITGVSSNNVGAYDVVITNIAGSAVSSNATLSITASAPVITGQPISQTANVGQTVTFSVSAIGTTPFTYQWTFDTTNLPDATNSTLTLTGVQTNQAGNYAVIVSNIYNSVTSSNATLTIYPPSITPFSNSLVLDIPIEGNVLDLGPNHFTVTTNGGVFVTNRFGTAASAFLVNGSNQNIWLPYNTNLYPTEMTLSLWVNPQSFNNIIWRSGNGSSDSWRGFSLFFWGSSGELRYEDYTGSGYNLTLDSSANLSMGQWAQVIITRTTNTCSMFINGAKVGFQTNLTAYAKPQVTPMSFGANNADPSGFYEYCNIIFDTIHIYNRALADSEVQYLYTTEASNSAAYPPTIVSEPTNLTVTVGSTAVFNVTAFGASPMSYQWTYNTTNILGATNSALTLTFVTSNQAGNYSVLVTNTFGSVLSSNAVLTVIPATGPTITSQPTNLTVNVSSNATFSVTATGTAPLSYQWTFNTTNIFGATNASLNLLNVQPAEAGTYAVVVTNFGGATVSSNAVLTVVTVPPVITQEPGNQTVFVGGNASFTVTATGSPPLSYQWSFDTTNILDATNATLSLANVQFSQAGNYAVLVSNLANSTLSSNALLTVNPAPPIPVITGFSPQIGPPGTVVNIRGSNFSATLGNNTVYFGAVLAAVTAASTTNLTVTVPVSATFAPITETVNSLTAFSDQPFTPTFPGQGGISSSSLASRLDISIGTPSGFVVVDLDGDGKPDIIAANSASLSIYRNISTNGSITAGSFAPPISLPLLGGPYIAVGDLDGDGRQDIVVAYPNLTTISIIRNISSPGSLTTNSFAPRIDLPAASTMRDVAVQDLNGDGKPEIVTANQNSPGSVSVFQNLSTIGNIAFAPRVDFAADNGPSGLAIGDLDGDGNPDIAVANYFSGTVSIFRNMGLNGNITTNSFASKVDLNVAATPFPIATGDLDGDGKLDLVVGSEPSSSCISVIRNISTVGSITTNSFAAPVTFPAAGWVNVVALGDIDGDGKIDIVAASQNGNALSIYKNISTPGSFTSASLGTRVDFPVAGNPYGVTIADLDGDSRPDIVFGDEGSSDMSIYRNIVPFGIGPVITNQPASLTVDLGATAVFSVTAGGTTPLSYQWEFDTTNLLGATNATLTLTNVQFAQAGLYAVLVTNNFGSVLSSNALLTVVQPPAITQMTGNQTNFVGTSAAFDVTATGTLPLTYQWMKNATNLTDGGRVSGSATTNLSLVSLQDSDAAGYSVVITNVGGSITSPPSLLVVLDLPPLKIIPSGSTLYLFWPISPSGFILESTPVLTQPAWTMVSTPPFQIGDQFLLPVQTSGSNNFYRLHFTGQ